MLECHWSDSGWTVLAQRDLVRALGSSDIAAVRTYFLRSRPASVLTPIGVRGLMSHNQLLLAGFAMMAD